MITKKMSDNLNALFLMDIPFSYKNGSIIETFWKINQKTIAELRNIYEIYFFV